MNSSNVMVIGIGFHARRIYVPILMSLSQSESVRLACGVDICTQRSRIDGYLTDKGFNFEMLYIDPFDPAKEIPPETAAMLDAFVEKYNIDGVVISTEPLIHRAYAEWALKRGLHILMDKPISIRNCVNSDERQAMGLIDDYTHLLDLYTMACKSKSTAFLVNVQRRYDYGFDKVRQLIREVRDKFRMPVTSIQAMHADGTWVFPSEFVNQESHPYKHGYGKCAHSGYHIFDMVWQLYKAGQVAGKEPNAMETFASFLSPAGFNINFSEDNYSRCFGASFEQSGMTQEEYIRHVANYGEVDAFSTIRLLRDNENICNININLLHSSFSRRAWGCANADLYKGNGRVKHQQFVIQQGPFQCIHIHNYQSKHEHDVDNTNEFDTGGNNHFDIYVFRNSQMIGSGKPFLKISSKELETEESKGLTIELVKERIIREFIDVMQGRISVEDVRSNIDTHAMPVNIMSSIYQSNAKRVGGANPLIRIDF